MIRPIDIRLNAAHPELPLAEAVTFTGAPSTVLVRGVPPNCGRWAITAVFVAATFPDGSTTTRAAVQSANGIWVATLPATATSGRTANGLRVMADGIDENGEAVTGYILGVADFAVASLGVAPAPEPGETSWQMLYFDATPTTPRKGDVIRVNGDLKFYNGTAWQPFTDLSNYYTAEQVDEAIDKLAAYYITADAQGNPFATHAALVNAQTYYSGGSARTPTRNDYAVVSADETHGGAEWRYIYATNAQGVGQWEPQYAVEGVIAYDDAVTRTSGNGVKSSGIWAAIWGTASTAFSSLYDWCVSQLGLKRDYTDLSYDTTETVEVPALHATMTNQQSGQVIVEYDLLCAEEVPDPPQIGHVYTWRKDGAAFYVTQGVSALQTTWTLYSYAGDVLGGVTTQNATQGFYPDVEFRPSNAVITIHKTTVQKQITTEDELALKSDIPAPSTATPAVDGTGAAGTSTAFARGDHVHPTDTSRMAASATGADIAVSGTDPTKIDAALAGKASKADVDPLLFAQYYPEGNVKSAAEFTQGIKYDAPDTTNRTITVKPFCNTGDSENDNSSLEGRVVIPPFVDASGNGYISDDGTRFKVVGASEGEASSANDNLTAVVAPNTMTTAGNNMFVACTALTSVSLPAAEGIGFGTFYYCTSLTYVDFGNTPRSSVPTLGTDAFSGVPTSCRIVVPYTQYDAWIAADGWKDLPQEFVRHAEKSDKPATFTTGNLAEFDSNGNPTDSGIKAGDLLTIVTLADSTETMASILARLNAINAAHKHVFFDCSGIDVNPRLYLCTIMINADANAVRVYDQVTGKLYIGPYVATETIGEVFAKAVDAYHSITVSAVTLDGVTVTGQTVTIREGTDATAPVYATATITDGAPVVFVVPKGMIYFLEITDALADHFGPRVTSGARQGIATADAAVTFTYYDAEHIDVSEITTFAKLQEALTWFGTNQAAARNNLVGIEIADTWTATNGTVYDNPRVVWDVHYFEDENGVSHLGALMGTKYCSHNDVAFDAAEGEECDSATETVAEADVYYYGLALGQTSKTAANLTLLELSEGDALPYADYAKIYKSAIRDTTRNSLQYGYNNWRDSAYRQYLNSDAAAGQWWGATHVGDIAPSQLNSVRGFMAGCSAALLAAAKKVKVATWPNSITDGPNQITTLYETLDTFFLPSGSEVYGNVNESGGDSVEGELSPYWQARTGYTAPNNAAISTRIIYRELPVGSTASRSAANVRLRSANRGVSHYVWYVYTSGQVTYNHAYNAYASVPACVIY